MSFAIELYLASPSIADSHQEASGCQTPNSVSSDVQDHPCCHVAVPTYLKAARPCIELNLRIRDIDFNLDPAAFYCVTGVKVLQFSKARISHL